VFERLTVVPTIASSLPAIPEDLLAKRGKGAVFANSLSSFAYASAPEVEVDRLSKTLLQTGLRPPLGIVTLHDSDSPDITLLDVGFDQGSQSHLIISWSRFHDLTSRRTRRPLFVFVSAYVFRSSLCLG
jgi:hypothetical protein